MLDELNSKLCDVDLELGCMISCYGMIIATMFTDDGKSLDDRFPPDKMNEALSSFLWQMEHIAKSVAELEELAAAMQKKKAEA